MISKTQKIISLLLKAVTVFSAAVGTFLSVYAGRNYFMGGMNAFMFFTIQSNIAIAIICVIGAVLLFMGKNGGKVWHVVKFVGTVSITLTCLVFAFVLAPTMGRAAWNFQNTLTHLVGPVAAILDFFVVLARYEIKKRNVIFVIIPPVLYAIYAGIGYVQNWQFGKGINYPYFFLNWGSPAGAFGFSKSLPYMGCAWWILLLLLFLIFNGFIYLLILDGIRKKLEKKKKLNPGYGRHKFLYMLLRPVVTLFLRLKFNFRRGKMHKDKGPFVLVCNHVTNFDMLFTSCSFKEYIYYVASEHTFRAGFASWLLRAVFDPIARTKASVAGSTVMEMKKRLKAGHNVGIFAEGLRTANGLTDKIQPATARVLKMFGVPVITFKLHGGFFAHPRWGYNIRRGYMEGELMHTYTPEEMKEMSAEELNDAINRDLFEDAYEWNKTRHIAYKGKRLAEGIEFELVACPKCKKLNSLKSKDDEFYCDCGLHGRYDEYGMLSGEGFEFTTIRDWDTWERQYIAELPDHPADTVLASNADQTLCKLDAEHNTTPVARGTLSITPAELRVGDIAIPLTEISLYDIILQGYLLFSTKDGTRYEIHDSEHKFAGFLYFLLIKRYKPSEVNENVKRK